VQKAPSKEDIENFGEEYTVKGYGIVKKRTGSVNSNAIYKITLSIQFSMAVTAYSLE
jgi:hypothetical protein